MNNSTQQCPNIYTEDKHITESGHSFPNCENCRKLNRLNSRLSRNEKFLRLELDRARKIQSRMLPDMDNMPLPQKLRWSGKYRPADMVGGDFYDARMAAPSSAAIIFGDVSGHGMGAALVTAVIKSAFQWWRPTELTPAEFMGQLNTELRQILPAEDFAAVLLGIFDATENSFTYINGGHNPEALLLPGDSKGTISQLDRSPGMLLGVLDEPQYHPSTIKLNRGDTILFVTDGIIECLNADGESFGQAALRGLAAGLAGRSADEIVSQIDKSVGEFAKSAEITDDQTIVAMQLKPEHNHDDWMI